MDFLFTDNTDFRNCNWKFADKSKSSLNSFDDTGAFKKVCYEICDGIIPAGNTLKQNVLSTSQTIENGIINAGKNLENNIVNNLTGFKNKLSSDLVDTFNVLKDS